MSRLSGKAHGSDQPLVDASDPFDIGPYFLKAHQRALDELFETPPMEFGRKDMGLLDLLCAPRLPGSEDLNIPRCVQRLDDLAALVKDRTERNLHRFRDDPTYGHCEPMWRMALLVTILKQNYGVAYHPTAREELLAGIESPCNDSKEVFIHGMLGDDPSRRWGTCASIPVLIAAVARRLHYPVGLSVSRCHLFARWEDRRLCFNIEASNPGGMVVHPDDHYRAFRGELTDYEVKSGFYVRTLFPSEEFAMFMHERVLCLSYAARYEETLLWSARALQFAPDDPYFCNRAYAALDLALKQRLKRVHPEVKIPSLDDPTPFFFDVGDLLRVEERSHYLTIKAHYNESDGKLEEAREHYENACRQNFHGNNEQRDLQRFLKKHNPPKRTNRLMPINVSQPRRIEVKCKPEHEVAMLRRLVDQCERQGELRKARDTLHDLYLFDPSDAEVFQRARAIEQQPQFQSQLRAVLQERRQSLQHSGRLGNRSSLQQERNISHVI